MEKCVSLDPMTLAWILYQLVPEKNIDFNEAVQTKDEATFFSITVTKCVEEILEMMAKDRKEKTEAKKKKDATGKEAKA